SHGRAPPNYDELHLRTKQRTLARWPIDPQDSDLDLMIVHNSLEHWARQRPDEIALVEGDRHVSYAEWNLSADRVASSLAARGIAAGDIVITRTQIRIEWAILAAALAKLGCKLLGLNWRLTPAEVQYVLTNSSAHAFVCDDADPAALLPAIHGLPI